MSDQARDLRTVVEEALPRLRALSEADSEAGRGPGKWIKKEILGHLIDSAANNHQRFVWAQFSDPLVWPEYEQERWVQIHQYRSRPWLELVELWAALNTHIAAVIEDMPE